MLVDDDIGVDVAINVGRWPGKDIHLHPAAVTVGRSSKVRVGGARRILGLGTDAVEREPAAAKVVVLKIAGLLGKTEPIGLVVIPVADVEELRYRSLLECRSGIC